MGDSGERNHGKEGRIAHEGGRGWGSESRKWGREMWGGGQKELGSE